MASGKNIARPTVLLACMSAASALWCAGCDTGSKGARSDPKSILSALNTLPTPADAARWAVDPYDADKRQRGILLLANAPFGGELVYVDLYEAALDDPDSGVRLSAIRGLALHGAPRHAPLIAPFLTDGDRLVRWEAARALQRIHNPEVVKPLIDRLDQAIEPDFDVRAAAATALGQYPERRVAQALIAALRDPSLLVNDAAERSLHTLTGQSFGYDAREWTKWLAASDAPFAGRLAFEYPVFHRDKRWYEWLIPFYRPPNETPGSPVGMASAAPPEAAKPATSPEDTTENSRSN